MTKTYYKVEYNPNSKTWCLFKHRETERAYNFVPIIQSENKKEVLNKLEEINNKLKENTKNKPHKKAIYNLLLQNKIVDTGTKDELMKRHKELKHNEFSNTFYKRIIKKYKIQRVK